MEESKFDPTKQYRWEPSDQFELTGADFNLAYNTLLEYVNTPEVRRVMRLVKTFEMMHQKFVDKVDCGIIKEVPHEQEAKASGQKADPTLQKGIQEAEEADKKAEEQGENSQETGEAPYPS